MMGSSKIVGALAWLATGAVSCNTRHHHLNIQLPAFLSAASGFEVSTGDVDIYTAAILRWYRCEGHAFPAWCIAARIVFAMSPNSASCERVFALLKPMFGHEQASSLQ